MYNTSVRLSKKEQIQQRRQAVLELSAQGLTQKEIADKLQVFHISQKTVSRDLDWLRKDAIDFVKKNREHIAFEYKQTLSNFYQLRKEAWKQFHDTKNEEVKIGLFKVISSLNQDLVRLFGIDDLAELEIVNELNERLERIENSTFQVEE
jgi:DNA-binding CsgD family transcriptional regulator